VEFIGRCNPKILTELFFLVNEAENILQQTISSNLTNDKKLLLDNLTSLGWSIVKFYIYYRLVISLTIAQCLHSSALILFSRLMLCNLLDLALSGQEFSIEFNQILERFSVSSQKALCKPTCYVDSTLKINSLHDLTWELLSLSKNVALDFEHSLNSIIADSFDHLEDDLIRNISSSFIILWRSVILSRTISALSEHLVSEVGLPFKMAKLVPFLKRFTYSDLPGIFFISPQEESLFTSILRKS
jgi:hypothetical protein